MALWESVLMDNREKRTDSKASGSGCQRGYTEFCLNPLYVQTAIALVLLSQNRARCAQGRSISSRTQSKPGMLQYNFCKIKLPRKALHHFRGGLTESNRIICLCSHYGSKVHVDLI